MWRNPDEGVLRGDDSTGEELPFFYFGLGLFGWVNQNGEGQGRPIRVGALWRSETVVNLVAPKDRTIVDAPN